MAKFIAHAICRNINSAGWAALLALCATLVSAQGAKVATKTPSQISALESSLHQQATAGEGIAIATIEEYPQYYTQMIVRTKSGEVELHEQYDEMVILHDGSATLYTGGTPQNLRTIKPGEQRGSAAPGSQSTTLTKGTLVYIPAGTPHQVIVPAGGSVAYIDVKVAHRP